MWYIPLEVLLKGSLPSPEELEEKILFELVWMKIIVANKVGSFAMNVGQNFYRSN
jgi:hypothetical protein